jgi:hypothetical protein
MPLPPPYPLPLISMCQFHMKQVHRRSEIRVRQGRALPIDYVARNLRLNDDDILHLVDPSTAPSADSSRVTTTSLFERKFDPDEIEVDDNLFQDPSQIFVV